MIRTILRIQYLRLRNNPLELVLVFVMPVIFFSIFAVIFSNGIAGGNDKPLRVGWISCRETRLAEELHAMLEGHESLKCTTLEEPRVGEELSEATVDRRVSEAQRTARYDLIVKLPIDFPEDLVSREIREKCVVSLVTDGQNPMAVAMLTSIVNGFFSQQLGALAAQEMSRQRTRLDELVRPAAGPRPQRFELEPVKDPSSVFQGPDDTHDIRSVEPQDVTTDDAGDSLVEQEMQAPVLNEVVKILIETPQAVNLHNPRIAMYAAGIAVLFLLFSATGNAAAMLEEAESGTLDRILVSRAGLFHIVAGKWLGIVLLGCLQITVMFLWAEAVFGVPLRQHLAGFAVMTLCTSAATASFAMFMATICKTRAQLNAVSVVLILSMSAVGGSMIPRFAMSDRMKEIGQWSFNAWALDGYQKVFWYQSPMASLKLEVAVLLGSAAVLGVLTLLLSGRWKRGP